TSFLMSCIELILERLHTDAAVGVDEDFAVLAQVHVNLGDSVDGINDFSFRESRANNITNGRRLVGSATQCHLIIFDAFFVDTKNTDMADMVVAAGIDAA